MQMSCMVEAFSRSWRRKLWKSPFAGGGEVEELYSKLVEGSRLSLCQDGTSATWMKLLLLLLFDTHRAAKYKAQYDERYAGALPFTAWYVNSAILNRMDSWTQSQLRLMSASVMFCARSAES